MTRSQEEEIDEMESRLYEIPRDSQEAIEIRKYLSDAAASEQEREAWEQQGLDQGWL